MEPVSPPGAAEQPDDFVPRPTVTLLAMVALAVALAPRLFMLNAPFGYSFDGWLGAMYGEAARNLVRVGPLELKLAPWLASGPCCDGVAPYLHHPPGIVHLLALSVAAFGDAEWAIRLPPLLALLAAIALLARIVARLTTPAAGAVAALLCAATPMVTIFGGFANYEPFVLFASALAYLLYLRYLDRPRPRRLAAVAAALVLALYFDWHGAFIAVPIGVHALIARAWPERVGEAHRPPLWTTPILFAVCVAGVGAVLASFEWVRPGAVGELLAWGGHRMGNRTDDFSDRSFTAWGWWIRQGSFLWSLHGPWAIGAALGLTGIALAWRPERRAAVHAALLLLPGLLGVFAFKQHSYVHSFVSLPLVLSFSFGGALLAERIARSSATLAGRRAGPAAALAVMLAAAAAMTSSGWRGVLESQEVALGRPNGELIRTTGAEIRAAVPFVWGVATPVVDRHVQRPLRFYADRHVVFGVTDLDALARARGERSGRPPVRYLALPLWVPEIGALGGPLMDAGVKPVRGQTVAVFDLGPP